MNLGVLFLSDDQGALVLTEEEVEGALAQIVEDQE